jgi:hypothetical protein
MEMFVFAVAVFVLAVYWIWRVRRVGTDDDPAQPFQGLPDDLREKNAAPPAINPMYAEIRAKPRVSRESGHGKDGGG